MDRSAVIVLAAGRGARFGSTKQLTRFHGRPLVAHAVVAAHAAGAGRVVVVVGADAQRVATAARSGGEVVVVHNPDHAAGQSTSLAAGIGALLAEDPEAGRQGVLGGQGGHPATGTDDPRAAVEVAVLVLADQPGIDPDTIRRVVAALAAAPDRDAARARYTDGPGHPVAFRRSVWPQLVTITGDRGARDLLETLSVVEVEVAGAAPRDVDTPADLDGLGDAAPGREPRGK
jgi:molybdenum cofactor cytidylyltransferase